MNELSRAEDKSAKNRGNTTRYNKFNNILNTNKLIDIGHICLPFTWWNSRSNDNAILERLDRVMTNTSWINLYKEAYVENLSMWDRVMDQSFYL